MFERMKIAEAIYKGGATSKNTHREEANGASFWRNKKGGVSALPSKPTKGLDGKRKRNNARHPSDAPTSARNICMLNIRGHSSEECKVLQDYSENHIKQQPFKYKQARSSRTKRGRTVNIESASGEANIMKNHDEPIPRNKKGKGKNKKTKSDQANADPSEDGRN